MIKITFYQTIVIKAGWFVNRYFLYYQQEIMISADTLIMPPVTIYPMTLKILKFLQASNLASHSKRHSFCK